MVMLSDRLDMIIAVDLDVIPNKTYGPENTLYTLSFGSLVHSLLPKDTILRKYFIR